MGTEHHNNGASTALVTTGMGGSLAAVTQQHAALLALKTVLRKGVDYGNIPGCGDKPTLLKPGAEKVLSRFGIAVSVKHLEDLSTSDYVRYRVTLEGRMMVPGGPAEGILVGEGIGECSGAEEKYAWKRNDAEWEHTPAELRRVLHKTGMNGAYEIKQVRTNPADNANTVLKMAKKRALVDLALTATAASDFYSQDLEDLPEDMRDAVAAERTSTASARAGAFRSQVNPNAPAPQAPVDVDADVMASNDARKAVWFAFCELQEWNPDALPDGGVSVFKGWVSETLGRSDDVDSKSWTQDDVEKMTARIQSELSGGEPPAQTDDDGNEIPF